MAEDRDPDLDIAIGEHAFRAGFEAGIVYRNATGYAISNGLVPDVNAAWSAYTPPEELTGGGIASSTPTTYCFDCGLPQFSSPSGITCENGHGGAEGTSEPTKEPVSRQPVPGTYK
jgi:hypothetical protein